MSRVISLDYLRGFCAFSIMLYHYIAFSELMHFDSSHFLGRIGRYGVSIFYILSGLTLYIVYNRNFDLRSFYVRRFFRIYPLLIVVVTLSIIIHSVHASWQTIFLNYSGLFGIFKHWDYIGTGVWSIGNELFFYLSFPLLLLSVRKNKYWLILVAAIIFTIYFYFAFEKLSPTISLVDQWRIYINPLNQIGLFFVGFLIGHYFTDIFISRLVILISMPISILAFIFWPVSGDTINLVTGANRIVFTIIGAGICILFYKLDYKMPFLHRTLTFLGEASYSVYLLHPIIWFLIPFHLEPIQKICTCIFLTLLGSYLVYNWFEKPFMQLGKKLST